MSGSGLDETVNAERQPLLDVHRLQTVNEADLVVTWDSPDDKRNPRNWAFGAKASILTILTLVTIISYLNLFV